MNPDISDDGGVVRAVGGQSLRVPGTEQREIQTIGINGRAERERERQQWSSGLISQQSVTVTRYS